jgi:hypothetical protein
VKRGKKQAARRGREFGVLRERLIVHDVFGYCLG